MIRHIITYKLFETATVQSAAVLIIKNKSVLILRRGKSAPWEPGKWNLPGGIVEDGETPVEAACRESVEECGIRPSNLSFVSKHNKDDWTIEFYKSAKYTGEVTLSTECDEYAWVTTKELGQFEFVPFVKDAIERVLSTKTFDNLQSFGEMVLESKVHVAQKIDNAVIEFNKIGPLKITKDYDLMSNDRIIGVAFINISFGNRITLREITINKDIHNGGYGTAFMEQLCAAADANKRKITLTPDSYKGSSKARLIEFYKRFGFVLNKGRKKDYAISDLMYREPE